MTQSFCPVCNIGPARSTYLPKFKKIRRTCVNGHMWDEAKLEEPARPMPTPAVWMDELREPAR